MFIAESESFDHKTNQKYVIDINVLKHVGSALFHEATSYNLHAVVFI